MSKYIFGKNNKFESTVIGDKGNIENRPVSKKSNLKKIVIFIVGLVTFLASVTAFWKDILEIFGKHK